MKSAYPAVVFVLSLACATKDVPSDTGQTLTQSTTTTGTTSTTTTTTGSGTSLPPLALCTSAPVPVEGPGQSWENLTSAVVALTSPEHSAQDVLTNGNVPAAMSGKFAYGLISKDLQGEWIEVWVDDCTGSYRLLGEWLTDGDGRIDPLIAADVLPDYGRYNLFFRVKGDQSTTASTLTIVPPGTQLLVFDIDGTLTTSDNALVGDVISDFFLPFLGDFVPDARPWALDLTQLRADQGYVFVFLTGRPYWLSDITRGWLEDLNFPVGTLHLTESNAESVPTNDATGEYKRAYLAHLADDLGFELTGAYGNATTDIYAYDLAGVAKDRTWIAGEFGGDEGTVDIGEGYEAHYAEAALEADAVQPFLVP